MSLQSINQNELKLKSNQKEEIKEQKPPPPKPVPKQSSFWAGGVIYYLRLMSLYQNITKIAKN